MKTLFDKVWEKHIVVEETTDTPSIIYIDLHLVHEVTSPQAFNLLRQMKLKVRCPSKTLATMDHSIPTTPFKSLKDLALVSDTPATRQLIQMEKNCHDFGIKLGGISSDQRGICHVIGPELGATQPGKTIVCGDSHTSTHGAFGALAFGIGTTEVGHVFATQCMLQRRPKNLAINLNGNLQKGVGAKDIILKIIGSIGVDGGTGYAMEFRGNTIKSLSMEERMTICNMTIEAGARTGMMAPDDTTYEYLINRPQAPKGEKWEQSLNSWRNLVGDNEAQFQKEVSIEVSEIKPMVTFGTNPGMVISIDEVVPEPAKNDEAFIKALDYMQVTPGKPLSEKKVDVVFIGSCTNSRLNDLEAAASFLKGRKVNKSVRMLVVPGSESIKREAEKKGIDKIFKESGAEWREAGCSMCLAMNGDFVPPGKLSVSTSNRNFEGRQGGGARTVLASPLTAAASAVRGYVSDPRTLLK
ncbi:MAG: 3-isopropylmalate dehydratase large subunit [Pseudomonadota bacterium]|nr:3-isopropylmalate dehydratase large subunit [Pseudomonadota bacterium]|tara:strand:+ start:825 stop:2228 length:1404 start_codon:yes stop_codon:yes gene_type:complete